MNLELIQSVRGYAAACPDVQELSLEEAERARVAAARSLGLGPALDRHWSWECLPTGVTRIPYGNGDGLNKLLEILPGATSESLLFVTDDEPPPWSCFRAPANVVVDLLREQRFFEFCLVDAGMRWIVFDTHHNELITLGTGLRTGVS